MTILEQLLTGVLFAAVLGSYVYVHKVEGDIGRRQRATEDCVERELKKVAIAVTDLTLAISVRLTAIETQLEIQLPQKTGGEK